MVINKAYRYKLEPTDEQRQLLAQAVGCCRFVYNHLLKLNIDQYAKDKTFIFTNEMVTMLPDIKKEFPWLNSPFSQSLQTAVRNLGAAFSNFFAGKTEFPEFHKKGVHDSFACPQKFRVEEEKGFVFIPKIGEVKIRVHKKFRRKKHIQGKKKSITVSRECGQWYICVLTEREIEVKSQTRNRSVGIDVGLKEFATLSRGVVIENPRFYRQYEEKLAKEQRKLSGMVKFSNNWFKQLKKVQKVHRKIANCREDFLHKESSRIVKNHDIIGLEDLCIKGMAKNHHLAKSIHDAGWGMFTTMLDYKAFWHGKQTVYVERFYPSSQLCSNCGGKKIMPLKLRTYICEDCNTTIDRDYNASINIEQRALELIKLSA